MLKFLSPVAESKLGYQYGKPQRINENSLCCVLPILRVTSLNRQYLTFPETEKVMVFDTGKIDEMEADNQTEQNVFVRSGTIFKGSTQPRALQRSVILFPSHKQKLNVRCIHQSHGISSKAGVKYGGVVPLDFDQMNYTAGFTPKDQTAYWANAQSTTANYSKMMGKKVPMSAPPSTMRYGSSIRRSMSREHGFVAGSHMGASFLAQSAAIGNIGADHEAPTAFIGHISASLGGDNLAKHFDEFAMHFDDVLSKVKLFENQAGLSLINQNGVETIEFFDHQESWKALHESAVKRLGSHIVDKGDENVFDYKPENAVKATNRVLAMDWKTNCIYKHKPSNGEPEVEITGLSADNYVGEAVELNGALIHLTILRQKQ